MKTVNKIGCSTEKTCCNNKKIYYDAIMNEKMYFPYFEENGSLTKVFFY